MLATLLAQSCHPLGIGTITCLVRSNECASRLLRVYGEDINLVVRHSLDDTEIATLIASKHDIVINCAPPTHAYSALALIEGLAKRTKRTGKDVWFLHTSGTENLADLPISQKWTHSGEVREFDDAKEDVFGFEREREAEAPRPQRTAELKIIEKGLQLGVKTLVVMNPLVYGHGLGLFERSGVRLSAMARATLETGRNVVIGDGKGTWDHVHVEELADLYRILVREMMKDGGKRLPSGKKGIIFSANGRHNWAAVAEEVAKVCYEEGFVKHNEVEYVALDEGRRIFSPHVPQVVKDDDIVELRLCSNAKTRSSRARLLGWKPTWKEEAWKQAIREEVRMVLHSGEDDPEELVPETPNSTYTW